MSEKTDAQRLYEHMQRVGLIPRGFDPEWDELHEGMRHCCRVAVVVWDYALAEIAKEADWQRLNCEYDCPGEVVAKRIFDRAQQMRGFFP